MGSGLALVQLWSGFGPALVRLWSGSGLALVRLWSGSGGAAAAHLLLSAAFSPQVLRSRLQETCCQTPQREP